MKVLGELDVKLIRCSTQINAALVDLEYIKDQLDFNVEDPSIKLFIDNLRALQSYLQDLYVKEK